MCLQPTDNVGNDWVLDNAHQSSVYGSTSTSTQYIQNTYHCLGKASVSFYAAIQTRLEPLSFLSSWQLLVLPLLSSMTLFVNHSTILFALLSVFIGLLLYSPTTKSGTPLPLRKHPVSSNSSSSQVRIPPLLALTINRAHMTLMTVLSILAVDFPVFPRNLVKPLEFLRYEA